jgi:hypothetical protein
LAAHHRQLEIWAANCPENFENRAALVGAEIARIEGRELEAERLYEQAIRSPAPTALSTTRRSRERARRALLRGARLREDSRTYTARRPLLLSPMGSRRQGAATRSVVSAPQGGRAGARSDEHDRAPVEHLDLATVIKVSQAVSGEIVLEKLIDTLMRTAIEHAGAERGLLILPRGDELRIEAEATTSGDTVRRATARSGGDCGDAAGVGFSLCHAHAGERHSRRC